MFVRRQVHDWAQIGIFLAVTLLCSPPGVVMACLAHYRSPEWQVANSPLIVIGEVEKIENGRLAKRAHRSGFGENEGESGNKTSPTIATVRILRILKGRYPEPRIRIGSGPVPTCGGDVHFQFELGRRSIFLLPLDARDGAVALRFGGSVLPLTETALIESRVARAIAYRDAYLDNLQREKPKVFSAARQLADEFRSASKRWPCYAYDEQAHDDAKEFKLGIAALEEWLARVDAETMVAAQAIDWLSDEPNTWSRHELWDRVIHQLRETRQKEAAAVQRAWVRKTLADAGVEQAQIDTYLEFARRDNVRVSLTFPIEPPFLWNTLREKPDGPVLTTDFILHYHAYDRGGMLVAYSPTFSAAVLRDLDMRRVKPLIESLYHSDGERLRWLAQQAIGYVPGTECVDIVLNDLVKEGHDWAWRVLAHHQCPKEIAPRLAALIDRGSQQYAIWGRQAMWRALKGGECFEEVCVEKALAALEQLESGKTRAAKKKAEDSPGADSGDERLELADELRAYLAAAKASREGAKPPVLTATAYRQWFQAHPAKKKGEEE